MHILRDELKMESERLWKSPHSSCCAGAYEDRQGRSSGMIRPRVRGGIFGATIDAQPRAADEVDRSDAHRIDAQFTRRSLHDFLTMAVFCETAGHMGKRTPAPHLTRNVTKAIRLPFDSRGSGWRSSASWPKPLSGSKLPPPTGVHFAGFLALLTGSRHVPSTRESVAMDCLAAAAGACDRPPVSFVYSSNHYGGIT